MIRLHCLIVRFPQELVLNNKVTDSRVFSHRPFSPYLEEQDRYLTRSEPPELRFGVIGCGMMGQEHIRNVLLVGRATIHGVFDPAQRSVTAAAQLLRKSGVDAKVYSNLEDACADPATDALIIASPNYTHLDVLRTAVNSGKALFIEKPLATTIEDANAACQLLAGYQPLVRFGLQYRYKAVYAAAIREVFEAQSIGTVHSINMLEHRFPFLDKVGQWNKFNAFTGGSLVEKCCHYFDLMNLFAGGMPEQVYAVGSQAVNFRDFSYDNRRADSMDQAQVTIRYDNDVLAAFSLCMFVPGAREELIVCGDAGRLMVSEQAQLGETNRNHLEVWRGENGVSYRSEPTYPSYIAKAGHHGSTFFEHAEFAEDLLSGGDRGPRLAEAFWSVVVGAAAQTSIEQGRAIEVAELLPRDFEAGLLVRGGKE